jgi:hypothetical protein
MLITSDEKKNNTSNGLTKAKTAIKIVAVIANFPISPYTRLLKALPGAEVGRVKCHAINALGSIDDKPPSKIE